mmetsp:Transcript_15390/g.42578  ORF Transcript_15390/g.42578 Transcript_15390/m.42578 type:complete len:305 (+) Transcript_15390:1031-1945(+)
MNLANSRNRITDPLWCLFLKTIPNRQHHHDQCSGLLCSSCRTLQPSISCSSHPIDSFLFCIQLLHSTLRQIALGLDFAVLLRIRLAQWMRSRPFLNALHDTVAIGTLHVLGDIQSQRDDVVNVDRLHVDEGFELIQFIGAVQRRHILAGPRSQQQIDLQPSALLGAVDEALLAILQSALRHLDVAFVDGIGPGLGGGVQLLLIQGQLLDGIAGVAAVEPNALLLLLLLEGGQRWSECRYGWSGCADGLRAQASLCDLAGNGTDHDSSLCVAVLALVLAMCLRCVVCCGCCLLPCLSAVILSSAL